MPPKPSPSSPPQVPPGTLITVLLADICDSTPSQEAGPGKAPDTLSRVEAFDAVRARIAELAQEVAERCGGFHFEVIADNFGCRFTNPQQAVIAALGIQATLDSRRAVLEPELPLVRIGLNTDVVRSTDTSALGPAANVAARVQGHAERGGVAVTDAVRGLCRGVDGLQFYSLGQPPLKGVTHRPELFAVTARTGSLPGLLKVAAAAAAAAAAVAQSAAAAPHPPAAGPVIHSTAKDHAQVKNIIVGGDFHGDIH
jgi:class 3 adenylate cyclase